MIELLGTDLGGSNQLPPRSLSSEWWGPVREETTLANLVRQPAVLSEDEETHAPVTVVMLTTVALGSCCDVQWIAPEGSVVQVGEPFARLYEVGSGVPREELATMPLRVIKHLMRRNDKAVDGSPICRATALGFSFE